MKQKILTIIFGMVLLMGIVAAGVSADRIIDNITGIYIDNFVAGSEVQANFSYDYLRDRPENPDNSPLILRLNITSNSIQYPVWRGDFEINGFIKRYILFGLIPIGEKHFTCSENESQTIIHPLGIETESAENGTFYCYDPEGDLDFEDFNSHDTVFLNIKSHPALWPGQYNLFASLYYLNDTYPPVVIITNKDAFDRYYRELDNIEVHAEINEVNLEDYWGTIFANENITVPGSHESSNIYHFTRNLPIDIPEGDYELKIFAEDSGGLIGSDNTTLRIDRTSPVIEAIQPNGSIYTEIIPLKINVSDEKSGPNPNEVYYRLREIVNGQICPEIGVSLGNYSCTRTDWINLPKSSTGLYEEDINTTELNLNSGEYWLDVKAQDILGNENYLQ